MNSVLHEDDIEIQQRLLLFTPINIINTPNYSPQVTNHIELNHNSLQES